MSNRALEIGVGILATIMVGWVLHVGAAIIQPFVIAFLLCVLLRPVVLFLARFYIPPAVTVVALVTLLFFGIFLIGSLMVSNARVVFEEINASDAGRLDLVGDEDEVAALAARGTWTTMVDGLVAAMERAKIPDELAAATENYVRKLSPESLGWTVGQTGVKTGVDFLRVLVLIVIYMLFIFAEQAVFRRKFLSVAGERRDDAAEALDSITRGIQRYLGVKTVTSLATGMLCYSVLLALEIPLPLLWGFLTFLLNYIPTFGSIIAGIFPTLVALAEGAGTDSPLTKAVIVVITYLTVNLTLGSFIEPKILGRELNLSPLVIVLSVVVWAGLWGVAGTFLAVPITATIQIILANTDTTRPLAVMLSSGPPREGRRRLLRRGHAA